jgi:hypothetical protein
MMFRSQSFLVGFWLSLEKQKQHGNGVFLGIDTFFSPERFLYFSAQLMALAFA